MGDTVSRDASFFGFSSDLEAVTRVPQGAEILIETHDCFSGQLKTSGDTLETLDWSITNPATGPLY
ncbi:MAG: acetamidase/formamidase family protein, partial [Coriobacteriia bacterium]